MLLLRWLFADHFAHHAFQDLLIVILTAAAHLELLLNMVLVTQSHGQAHELGILQVESLGRLRLLLHLVLLLHGHVLQIGVAHTVTVEELVLDR